ncbi:hypothetical protein CAPTEDRAFT_211004 [Capitella teleta]|uniref:Uncharacterized protein n=1 Tax=Capitella teleta TaxID=283909 RepID=R7VFW7_CAPTE|nr:hypothetical protein CAPTEDRAFT_211004 [Capitella teleta]|eukprot:ELU14580.1 hypothetical protein CAPTEDRAFT_211004 [Capitella teleta]
MASKRKQSLESWIVKKQRLDPSRSPPGPPPTAAPTTGTQKRNAHRISGFNQEWSKEYSWLKEVDGGMVCTWCTAHRRKGRNRLIDTEYSYDDYSGRPQLPGHGSSPPGGCR